MNEILLITGMTLVTFSFRYPILAILGKLPLPDPLFQALKFVPPAVLTAISVPALLIPSGDGIQLTFSNAPLVAGVLAALVAWKSKNLLVTILVGMLALWGWQWVLTTL